MSADSFHALVEKRMRQVGSIYDFEDFSSLVGDVGEAVIMQPDDFRMFQNEKMSGKKAAVPKMASEVEFRKGFAGFFFKTGYRSISWCWKRVEYQQRSNNGQDESEDSKPGA